MWMLVAEEPVSMWKSLHGDASEEESELKEGAYTQLTSSSSCSEADKGRGKEGSEGESEGEERKRSVEMSRCNTNRRAFISLFVFVPIYS